jgi:5-methylcytosine-specific restriction endonuclease McrA
MNLRHLTDKALLADTKKLAHQERIITASILHHLKEIERRRLFSDLGYSSLFHYATKDLGFSDGSAMRRINSARLLADLPSIEAKIKSGELNLTNVASAAQTFKNEEIDEPIVRLEILSQIENTSKKECEDILREYSSKAKMLTTVQANLREEDVVLLNELKGLLAHCSKDLFWHAIFEAAITKIKTDKFHLNNSRATTSQNPRYVTAEIKKDVFLRDQACQKCGSNYALEYDHISPYSHGGKSTKENLRILCRSCNQRNRITQKL